MRGRELLAQVLAPAREQSRSRTVDCLSAIAVKLTSYDQSGPSGRRVTDRSSIGGTKVGAAVTERG
jgi:hypothetical protein